MNKTISAVILGLMLVAMLGVVSADAPYGDTTAIAGKIYNADYSATVSGATVDVTCGTDVELSTQHVTSLADGTYSVKYSSSVCHQGSLLSVHALKDGVGENTVTGDIHDNYPVPEFNLNLGVVNVPLVPEFGAVVGVVTILGALGVFFVVRRK
jgi:hypothetical protein